MTSAADRLIAKLDAVRSCGPGRWLARCPGHEDKRASLSVRELDDGRVLVHCFAGCSAEEVVHGAGLQLSDLYPPRTEGDFVKGERRPWPAADVLRAVDEETLLVATAAVNIGNGVELTALDRSRILVAAERIRAARRLALGQH